MKKLIAIALILGMVFIVGCIQQPLEPVEFETIYEGGSSYFWSEKPLGIKHEFIIDNQADWEAFYEAVHFGAEPGTEIIAPEVDFDNNIILSYVSTCGPGTTYKIIKVKETEEKIIVTVEKNILKYCGLGSAPATGIFEYSTIAKISNTKKPIEFTYNEKRSCR